jgi:hypothetical protein
MALNLLAKLGLDISPFTRGLNAAQNAGKRTADVFARDIGPSIKEGLFGALSAGAFVGGAKQIIDYAGRVNDLSEQFGIAREEIQTLAGAAEDSGLEFERLGGALDKIGQSRRDAAEGNAKLREEFAKFGISLADLNDPARSNLDLLKAIGVALATMTPTAAIRESFGELVGEKGQRLLELVKTLKELKPISLLSDSEIKTLDEFGDRANSIFRSFKTLGGRALSDAISFGDEVGKANGGGIKGGMMGALGFLTTLLQAPINAITGQGAFGPEGATEPLTPEEIAAAKANVNAPPLFTETEKAARTASAKMLPTFDPRIPAGGLASAGLFFGGAGNPLIRESKQQSELARQSVEELRRVRAAIREEL